MPRAYIDSESQDNAPADTSSEARDFTPKAKQEKDIES